VLFLFSVRKQDHAFKVAAQVPVERPLGVPFGGVLEVPHRMSCSTGRRSSFVFSFEYPPTKRCRYPGGVNSGATTICPRDVALNRISFTG